MGVKLNTALAVQPPSFVSLSNAAPFQAIARSANQEPMTLHADDEDVFAEFRSKLIDFDGTAVVSQALNLAHWMPLQWLAVERRGAGEKPVSDLRSLMYCAESRLFNLVNVLYRPCPAGGQATVGKDPVFKGTLLKPSQVNGTAHPQHLRGATRTTRRRTIS